MDGPRLILLVPEQASLQMERAILTSPPGTQADPAVRAAHRAEVLSFERLAYRVLDTAGDATRRALSEPARVMVLRHLLLIHAPRLQYYGGLARRAERGGRVAGFLERLAATIVEFIQECVEPEDLSALAASEGGDATSTFAAERSKFSDLALIYRAYLDSLGDDKLDPSQHLSLARERLTDCHWLADAELWVDGFASLSGQETGLLIALARKCRRVDITVMVDPGSCMSFDGGAPTGDTAQLFSRTSQTYRNLHARLVAAGLEVIEPLTLMPCPPPRFAGSAALARIEVAVFQTAGGQSDEPEASGDVRLVKLPTRRLEVEYAVAQVCDWLRDPSRCYRLRDIAIIARDLEPYHDLFQQALAARGIPFFVDRRRSVSHHPLIELLRGGVVAAVERLSVSSVRLLLATGLLSMSDEAADEIENYLLAQGISGIEAWRGTDWSARRDLGLDDRARSSKVPDRARLASVNETRRALWADLGEWIAFAERQPPPTGAEWAASLTDWMVRLDVAAKLQSWATGAEDRGDFELAEEHRQVWRDAMAFLDDLAFAFGATPLAIGDLLDVLEAGLGALTLGLVPPVVDQVLVGSIERSRHPDIKASVVVGLNDGVFPKKLSEDSILNDDDRVSLADGGIPVRPPTRDRVVDETLLAYVALTRASDAVVCTFAAADGEGKSLRPSPYVDAIRAAGAGIDVQVVFDPTGDAGTWDLLTTRDLARRMATVFRDPPGTLQDDGPATRARWYSLYDASIAAVRDDAAGRRSLKGLCEREAQVLAPAVAQRVHAGRLSTSVSQLETYAKCSYQHFTRFVLRLKERDEVALRPLDIGLVHHAILEDFVAALTERRTGLGGLSDQELVGGLRESCARVAERLADAGVLSDARNAYVLRRSASTLQRVLRAQCNVAKAGRARPHAAELPFGLSSDGGMPALVLSTPKGRSVELRGVIDRVDLVEHGGEMLGIVIDYKGTRDKQLRLSEVYYGSALQLLTYLIAIEEFGAQLAGQPIRPAAALYVSLAARYHPVDHPDDVSRETAQVGTYRPRGLILADVVDALDEPGQADWSANYGLYRKKNGEFGHDNTTDWAPATAFEALLRHTRRKLGELADGVLDGMVAAQPYRLNGASPCKYCAMKSVCRFEVGITEIRYLPSMKRTHVMEILTQDSA